MRKFLLVFTVLLLLIAPVGGCNTTPSYADGPEETEPVDGLNWNIVVLSTIVTFAALQLFFLLKRR